VGNRLSIECRPAREHFVHQHRKRPDIRAFVHLPALRLFRVRS
jgi:hypothetical protein